MPEAWPADVPHTPIAGSFQGTPFRAADATEFEDGPARARRRSTLRIATLRFAIRMSNAQFDAFHLWVNEVLIDGTLPFYMPVWRGGGFVTKLCRFTRGEPFSDDPGQGLRHRVSVSLDVEDY
ncbi:hypothetical protein [uncultured Devosia sp.]|uniref:hypothetical protein n=1 Tax=uncultured Devosia sp. TaxID=211434 RepID=UPI00261F3DC1|nr:hypothetical protein [uncultured Devosia sp.]